MEPSPPPGWYDDPEYPAHLRYWNGELWTEHRAPRGPGVADNQRSGLSDIGSWLANTFKVLTDRPIAVFAFLVGTIIGSLIFGVVVLGIWDELRFTGDGWEGFSGGRLGATIAAALLLAVFSAFLYLALAHQFHGARLGHDHPLEHSFAAAARALPRLVGWALALIVGLIVISAALSLLVAAVGALGVLVAIFGGVPFMVWASVKLSFLGVACVVPVPGKNPVQASADVSNGRFWAVTGRLVLLGLIVVGISLALNVVLSPFTSTPTEDDFDRYLVVEDGEVLFLDVGGLLDEAGLVGPGVLVSALPSIITNLIALAGVSSLYAEIHGDRRSPPAT